MHTKSPYHQAAQLISEAKASSRDIAIQPKGDHERGYANEIIEVKADQVEKQWQIEVRQERMEDKLNIGHDELKMLFPKVAPVEVDEYLTKQMEDWWMAIDEELQRIRISHALADMKQQLGTTTTENQYWKLLPNLTEKQKAVLCYFIPYQKRIQNDAAEMAFCFSTFLNKEIEIERINKVEATNLHHKSKPIHQWQIGLNSVVGGLGTPPDDELLIHIKCKDQEELQSFLPNTNGRWLLEKVLIPSFVAEEMGSRIILEVENEYTFVLDEMNRIGFFKISA